MRKRRHLDSVPVLPNQGLPRLPISLQCLPPALPSSSFSWLSSRILEFLVLVLGWSGGWNFSFCASAHFFQETHSCNTKIRHILILSNEARPLYFIRLRAFLFEQPRPPPPITITLLTWPFPKQTIAISAFVVRKTNIDILPKRLKWLHAVTFQKRYGDATILTRKHMKHVCLRGAGLEEGGA